MKDIVLKKDDYKLYTTSLLIAETFKKQHKTVIRKIESLSEDTFNRLKIVPVEYIDAKGEARKMYELDRDAFCFIAMGFTGKEAENWKLKFIEAFNKMEDHLHKLIKMQARQAKKDWLEHRLEAALEYKMMSMTLEEVRKLKGKETKFFHYANEAKLVNFALTGEYKKVDRERLSEIELNTLTALEAYNAVLLGAGHDRGTRKELLKSRSHQLMQSNVEHMLKQ